MGKGDKKSRRGKIIRGTYGVLRKRKKKVSAAPVPPKDEIKKAAEVTETKSSPARTTAKTAKPKPAAKPAARAAAKKSDQEKKPAAAKTAKPATKAKKTSESKEE
jgi:ribosomal small subunit protein bTHX